MPLPMGDRTGRAGRRELDEADSSLTVWSWSAMKTAFSV